MERLPLSLLLRIRMVVLPNKSWASGKVPILDGHKAAVSVLLNKQGAKILWESFKTPTPDMSVSFEMTFQGYRSPKRVIIDANFDQIYESSTFQAAASTTGPVLLAAEINATFEDLRKSGVIKVQQFGEDAQLEKALETTYSKLMSMMFDPAGGSRIAFTEPAWRCWRLRRNKFTRSRNAAPEG